MKGLPSTFWGKLTKDLDGVVTAWHPLQDHCADVAAVTEALLALPLWRMRMARLAGRDDLSASICARLCVLSALHDLGKFTTPFQAKGRPDLRVPEGGHVEAGLGALIDARVQQCLQPLETFGAGVYGLLAAALAHHGEPKSFEAARASHQHASVTG